MSAENRSASIGVASTVRDLRATVARWRQAGERIALVPTMGALHEGHLALVRRSRAEAERVIVSIFVNPTQFAPGEDLSAYPRTFEEDCAKLSGFADLVYAPGVQDVYPPGSSTVISLEGPATVGLEDRFRPTHFRGVATVCTKLFVQALPDLAVFGEKDFQQLRVIERLVADLSLPLRIAAHETVREPDGLAMSSRNRFLSPEERRRAAALPAELQLCAERLRGGQTPDAALGRSAAALAEAGFALDYLEARRADTLEPAGESGAPLRLLVAARLGRTRLIDNVAI